VPSGCGFESRPETSLSENRVLSKFEFPNAPRGRKYIIEDLQKLIEALLRLNQERVRSTDMITSQPQSQSDPLLEKVVIGPMTTLEEAARLADNDDWRSAWADAHRLLGDMERSRREKGPTNAGFVSAFADAIGLAAEKPHDLAHLLYVRSKLGDSVRFLADIYFREMVERLRVKPVPPPNDESGS